ncbi:MAG: DUF3467 domain-containing protein [Methylocystaceae bacterium]|nr:DUF3467 domain-containing protein [Methylocystaceae bacterium]
MTTKNDDVSTDVKAGEGAVPPEAVASKIIWNDSNMTSKYANVSNVATTSDEVMFLFGTSTAWNSAQKDVVVNLSDRIIMTPSAAKRFQQVLTRTLEEYEKKFGQLD